MLTDFSQFGWQFNEKCEDYVFFLTIYKQKIKIYVEKQNSFFSFTLLILLYIVLKVKKKKKHF